MRYDDLVGDDPLAGLLVLVLPVVPLAGRDHDLAPGPGVDRSALCRSSRTLGVDVCRALRMGQESGGAAFGLVLLLQLGDAVVLLGLLVIEPVLSGVDHDHGVPDGAGQLSGRGALELHVGDQVRDDAHLLLGVLLRHDRHARPVRVRPLRVESLEALKKTGKLNLTPVLRGLEVQRQKHSSHWRRKDKDALYNRPRDRH